MCVRVCIFCACVFMCTCVCTSPSGCVYRSVSLHSVVLMTHSIESPSLQVTQQSGSRSQHKPLKENVQCAHTHTHTHTCTFMSLHLSLAAMGCDVTLQLVSCNPNCVNKIHTFPVDVFLSWAISHNCDALITFFLHCLLVNTIFRLLHICRSSLWPIRNSN